MRLLISIAIIILTLNSCSYSKKLKRVERKIEKLTIKYPTLIKTDTLRDTVRLITKEVKLDTAFLEVEGDTTYIVKDKLKIKYVRVNDTVHIEGKCESDTIYKTVEIPYENIVVREVGILEQLGKNIKGILISLLVILILAIGIRIAWKILI